MKVFDFQDYKKYVLAELGTRPKGGHGEFQRIAKALKVHSTMVTHVLKGHLHLSAEQSLALAEYLGLGELETDYLLALVQLARAGDPRTRRYFEQQLTRLKDRSLNLGARLTARSALSEQDQAMFYSSWVYAAIRLLSAVPALQTRAAFAETLGLPPARVNQAVDFLVSRGLCEEKGKRVVYRELRTYVGAESPLAARHHANWRARVVSQLETLGPQELAFTYPTVISEADFLRLREELVRLIERFKKECDASPSEKLYCLNVDWVEIRKA